MGRDYILRDVGAAVKLVMGSCRIVAPLSGHPDVVLYPGGHVHSSAEFLQAIRIMRGELSPPTQLGSYLFWGGGVAENKIVDLSAIDTVAIELSSLKNHVYQEWLLNAGWQERVQLDGSPMLEGVELRRETRDDVLGNLDTLREWLPSARFIVLLQNNIPQLRERYLLASAAADWCHEHGAQLIDATAVIAQHGASVCLEAKNGKLDTQHYTAYMRAQVAELFEREQPDLEDRGRKLLTSPRLRVAAAWWRERLGRALHRIRARAG